MKRLILSLFLFTTGLHASEADLKSQLEALQAKEKEKVLAIVEKQKDTIVMAEVVVKVSAAYGGRQRPPREQKLRIAGTVIRSDGLTLLSNSYCDPAASMSEQRRAQISLDVEVLSSKLILNDGTEVPAKIVLKDADLDLAFMLPEEPGTAFPHVTLDKSIKPDLLDTVISLQRMDFSANRTPLLKTGPVAGIIEKPRTYYVGPQMSPGHPALDEEGRCFGFFLRGIGIGAQQPVILPAEDIMEVVAQIKPTSE